MDCDFEMDHVQIAIPKGGEDKARVFYRDLLGLNEIAKPADIAARGGCWFDLGHHQIHLGADLAFVPAKKAHVALTTDWLDALRARLEVAGYETLDDTDVEGRQRFFTHDPFGNRIEFMDRMPRS